MKVSRLARQYTDLRCILIRLSAFRSFQQVSTRIERQCWSSMIDYFIHLTFCRQQHTLGMLLTLLQSVVGQCSLTCWFSIDLLTMFAVHSNISIVFVVTNVLNLSNRFTMVWHAFSNRSTVDICCKTMSCIVDDCLGKTGRLSCNRMNHCVYKKVKYEMLTYGETISFSFTRNIVKSSREKSSHTN
jgi:hypothetical protein